MVLTRREELLRPHAAEHLASVERKAVQPPNSLSALMQWFLKAWGEEMPDALHAAGVWFGGPKENGQPVTKELQGGSLIGTPRFAGQFAHYLFESDYSKDEDGYYIRPLRQALAWMRHQRRPLQSRWLLLVGLNGGNWQAVCDMWRMGSFTMPHELGEVITYAALRECRRAYTADPKASVAA